MNKTEINRALKSAVDAAQAVGVSLRRNLRSAKHVNSRTAHDVKLELDVRSQNLIERRFKAAFPEVAFLGEEGVSGDQTADLRWVVDPIDGTMNFSHGIPHACISIALQERGRGDEAIIDGGYRTIVGVVYDPFMDELWTATTTSAARLNGRRIQVGSTPKLSEAILAMGFGKNTATLKHSLHLFGELSLKARKVRSMGSAALALTYVASGRFDGYVERGISLWDIAAGGFILERAGGEFWRAPVKLPLTYRMVATNGRLRRRIEALQTYKQFI